MYGMKSNPAILFICPNANPHAVAEKSVATISTELYERMKKKKIFVLN